MAFNTSDSFGYTGHHKIARHYTPTSYTDALRCPDAHKWIPSIKAEYQNMVKHGVFKIVDHNDSIRNVAKPKLVFKVKYNRDGSIDKYKTRLTLKGYTQRRGIDFNQTFAPVVRQTSLRIMLSLVCQHKLSLKEFDVSGAFLTAFLEPEYAIYMSPPPGMKLPKGKILKLLKALYGAKQSGRLFNREFSSFLRSLGLIQSILDPCIFSYNKNGKLAFLSLHVDDGLFACNCPILGKHIISKIEERYELGTLRDASFHLGVEIDHNKQKNTISISMPKYTSELARGFGCTDSKPVHNPCASGLKLVKNTGDPLDPRYPYAELVGSLLWLANMVRPDISQIVGDLSAHISNPSLDHWHAAKRVLKYVISTKHMGITFTGNHDGIVRGFSDSDHARIQCRKSVSGRLVFIGTDLVSWSSKRQRTPPALSSCEAELIAAVECAKDLLFTRNLLRELNQPATKMVLRVDNQPAIDIMHNPSYHGRVKHIDVRYHFCRHLTDSGDLTVLWVPTKVNPADALTKPLPTPQFLSLRNSFMRRIIPI